MRARVDNAFLLRDMISSDDVARLALLGLRVATDVPIWATHAMAAGAEGALMADMGIVANLHTGKHRQDPRRRVQVVGEARLEKYARQLYGSDLPRALPARLSIEDYLMVADGLAGWLEQAGLPRVLFGSAWAVTAGVVGRSSIASGARAVQALTAAGVDAAEFYETLNLMHGARGLARGIAVSVFRHAHPELHPSLVWELFA